MVVVPMSGGFVFRSCPRAKQGGPEHCQPRVAPSGGNSICEGTDQQKRHELLWQDLFLNPALWWDDRHEKRSPCQPDFRHKRLKEALWLDNRYKPAWVEAKLALRDAQLRLRRRGPPGSSPTSSPGSDHGLGAAGDMDIQTWRKLCEEGQVSEAVNALDLLVHRVPHVDTSIFYFVLKGCIAQKDLVLGRRVHLLTIQCGYASDAFLANHIIRMYASHGKLEEATQVFTKIPAPDTYLWASIISAHADHGQPTEAIHLYRQMRQLTVKPNSYVFVAVLKACATAADLNSGKEVHADIVGNAAEDDIFVGNSLVNMYAKCKSLKDARRVFDTLPTRDVVTWNAMIAGYAQHGLGQEALAIYASMQLANKAPASRVTFVSLLKACSSVGALSLGMQLHEEIQQKGLAADVVVGSCLVDMYAKCGELEHARSVFEGLLTKDVVTWNAMITGYAQHGQGQEALALYAQMQQDGMTPADNVTFVSLLQACASVGALYHGKKLHAHIGFKGLDADVIIGGCLVDMYAKCGCVDEARRVFDNLPSKSVVTWNAMLAGYVHHGLGHEALAFYASMQLDSMIVADKVTFVCLLRACGSVGALHQGKQLCAQIQQTGLDSDVDVGSCLVDMYAKCGSMDDARRVFDALPKRDVVTWNALLNSYAQHSDGQMAVQCFEEMQLQGIKPDDVTFLCLLVACSHDGLVNEGQQYYELMFREHGVAASEKHDSCIVDLLGRSGRLDEAETMLQTVRFETNVVGWISLLSACKSYGDIDRGKRCFDRLVVLDPGNAVPYVLLGNIYASAGRWRDVDAMERLRKCAGAWKKPAKACIEVKNEVHQFTVGEERADISSKLKSMNLKLKKEGGHVPQTDLVLQAVSESEKADALCGHAEKLALAYGLLNTAEGTPLLVTKNLRMCNDCHSSTKIMSRLEKREIVVRDAHRVHRFLDGACLCGDRH